MNKKNNDSESDFEKEILLSASEIEVKPTRKRKYKRVHEVAAEFGTDSRHVCEILKDMNERVKGPSSSIVPPVYQKLSAALEAEGLIKLQTLSELTGKVGPGLEQNDTVQFNSPTPSDYSPDNHEGKGEVTEQKFEVTSKPRRKKQLKPFVYQRRLLDARIKDFKRQPSNGARNKVIEAFEIFRNAVIEYEDKFPGRDELINHIASEAKAFTEANLLTYVELNSSVANEKSRVNDRALKPLRTIFGQTPIGPRSDNYYDNPIQDK